jgi:hypothetical protein
MAEDHDASVLADRTSLRLKMKKIEKAMLERGEEEEEEDLVYCHNRVAYVRRSPLHANPILFTLSAHLRRTG